MLTESVFGDLLRRALPLGVSASGVPASIPRNCTESQAKAGQRCVPLVLIFFQHSPSLKQLAVKLHQQLASARENKQCWKHIELNICTLS